MVFIIGAALAAFIGILLITALFLRTVVSTNDVHIIQSGKSTVSYGKGQTAGNVYYAWPSWMPKIGIKVIRLPMSIFDVPLEGYAAYDKGRVPFIIDVMAFFRISDSNMAAQRVHAFDELQEQLESILQGCCRTILASSEIEEILEGRGKFGEMFTMEVDENLREWGVQSVKMIELMDIRDAEGSKVIHNIMAKKKSFIEMQSRTAVAENLRQAQNAETEAQRDVDVQRQAAAQQVGIRTAEKEREVGIANEQASQQIKEQARITAEKDMAVKQVNDTKAAEIARAVEVVNADKDAKALALRAEGQKVQTILIAEGKLEEAKRNAEGIRVEGEAKGSAEQAMLIAPVNTQITLAREIGQNSAYQQYLIAIETVNKDKEVGMAQAGALKAAEIKVIVNSGHVTSGVENILDVFTSKGGSNIGAMLEGLKNTPTGAAIVEALTGKDKPSESRTNTLERA